MRTHQSPSGFGRLGVRWGYLTENFDCVDLTNLAMSASLMKNGVPQDLTPKSVTSALELEKGSAWSIACCRSSRFSSPTKSLLDFMPAVKQRRDLRLCWWRLVKTDSDLHIKFKFDSELEGSNWPDHSLNLQVFQLWMLLLQGLLHHPHEHLVVFIPR